MFSCLPILALVLAEPLKVVVEQDVPVPMRDGTILRANVSRPDRGGPYPVLVSRTPYGKRAGWAALVKAGYIVVIQDIRGRYASDGKFESFVRFDAHDAEDGYDTIEWAARLPGSSGKVGAFGHSYGAYCLWKLAPLRPPSLVAMSATSIPGRYTDLEGPGTIRPGRRLEWWHNSMAPDMRLKTHGKGITSKPLSRKLWKEGEGEKWLQFLPWLELPHSFFEFETDAVHYWLKNPHTDPWKFDKACHKIAVPNLDIVGWYDHCSGQMLTFNAMRKEAKTEVARRGTKIVIGPWPHGGTGRKFGNIDFGREAVFKKGAEQMRWFDYWLKGKDNGVDKDPPLRIFVMGDNQWRGEEHWPLKRTREQIFFLTSGGKANTPQGDGKLVAQKLPDPGSDTYEYDPADPVPSLAGIMSIPRASDQRRLAGRQDILVYASDPVDERIEVTGHPVVELYAATSAPDTDWFVRLIDVAPDGLARDVSTGLVRARYRDGLDKPKLLVPGEVVKYTIRMNATSNAFLPGHRIRLDITSSDFPSFDRNHNTATDQNADATLIVATQTIHHGGVQATRIILPRVPNPTSE